MKVRETEREKYKFFKCREGLSQLQRLLGRKVLLDKVSRESFLKQVILNLIFKGDKELERQFEYCLFMSRFYLRLFI